MIARPISETTTSLNKYVVNGYLETQMIQWKLHTTLNTVGFTFIDVNEVCFYGVDIVLFLLRESLNKKLTYSRRCFVLKHPTAEIII